METSSSSIKTTQEIIRLDPFQGHIVLLSKGWYKYNNLFEALRMIWAIRCGYDYKFTTKDVDSYIADEMWKIIMLCCPERLGYYIDNFHRGICEQGLGKPKDMTPIQAIIYQYYSIISGVQIRKRNEKGEYIPIIILPKPLKRVFNRILRGNGRYSYYKLIS